VEITAIPARFAGIGRLHAGSNPIRVTLLFQTENFALPAIVFDYP
jgi:hypothetical protein